MYLWSTHGFLCTFAPSPSLVPFAPCATSPHLFVASRGHMYIYPYTLLLIFRVCYLFTLLSHYSSPAPTRSDTLGVLRTIRLLGTFPRVVVHTRGGRAAYTIPHENEITFIFGISSREYQRLTGVPSTGALNGVCAFVLSRLSARQMKVGYPDRARFSSL